MKLQHLYTLLTLITVFYFVPVNAQTTHKAKKTAAKSHAKPAAKKANSKKQPAKTVSKAPAKTNSLVSKIEAKNLGEAAAKDTTKKGGKNGDKDNQTLSEEIVVTTAYKPVLADAVKIRRNPELEDKFPFKAPLSYNPIDKRLEKNEEIKQLNAMKMPAERDSVLEPDYVKAGIGNMKTTYAEAYITNGRDQALQIGGYAKHFSQQGDLLKQNQSKNSIGIFGKSINDENALSGRIDYSYNSNYFYGYNTSAPMPIGFNPGKQHFSTISGEGEIAKNYKDVPNDFTYAAKLQGYAFSDAYKARENNVVLSGFINETVKQFYAGLSGSLDLTTQNDSLYSYNNSLLRLNPYIKFQGDIYKVDAGINIVDQFGYSSNFYLFPAAKGELQVIPKYVRLFLEVKGDVNKTTLRGLTDMNPFIGQDITIKNSVDKLDVSAGLKGTLAPGLSFKADIYRNSIHNMPLFVTNFMGGASNKFAVIYDGGNSRVNGFNGELDFKPADELDIFGRVEFKDYQMATEAQAWNLPKFKLTAGTAIKVTDNVTITGTLLIRGSAYSRDVNTTVNRVTINSFADLSGGVDYKVNRHIFIFGKVNNILNTSNQTWQYYPDYGFNIFGGAGYSF